MHGHHFPLSIDHGTAMARARLTVSCRSPRLSTAAQSLDAFLELLVFQRVDERVDASVAEGGDNSEVVPDAIKVEWPSKVELKECELIRSPTDEVDNEQDEESYGDVSAPSLRLL